MGRTYYSESQTSPFLAGSGAMVKESVHSEETLREIDLEVKRIVDESYRNAYEVLMSQKETLDHLSKELFEIETMSADQMHAIIDEHRDGPKIVPGTSAAISTDTPPTASSAEETSEADEPDVAGGPA